MGSSSSSSSSRYNPLEAVNVKDFVVVKLSDSNNYSEWRKLMLEWIAGHGLLEFVSPPKKEKKGEGDDEDGKKKNEPTKGILGLEGDTAESKQRKEMEKENRKRNDMLVRGWILSTLHDKLLVDAIQCESAAELWTRLERTFSIIIPAEYHNEWKTSNDQVNTHQNLHKALVNRYWEVAKRYLDDHPDSVEVTITSHNENALLVAVKSSAPPEFLQVLADMMNPEAVAQRDRGGSTALHAAARAGNIEAAQVFLGKNPFLCLVFDDSQSLPLHQAAVCGRKDMVRYLWRVHTETVKILRDIMLHYFTLGNAKDGPFYDRWVGELMIRYLLYSQENSRKVSGDDQLRDAMILYLWRLATLVFNRGYIERKDAKSPNSIEIIEDLCRQDARLKQELIAYMSSKIRDMHSVDLPARQGGIRYLEGMFFNVSQFDQELGHYFLKEGERDYEFIKRGRDRYDLNSMDFDADEWKAEMMSSLRFFLNREACSQRELLCIYLWNNGDLKLLLSLIGSRLYDVAIEVLMEHPGLALKNNPSPLEAMPLNFSESDAGQSINLWQYFMTPKQKHVQSGDGSELELVKRLCQEVGKLDYSQASWLVGRLINFGISRGNPQVVNELLAAQPSAIHFMTQRRQTILHLAIVHRCEGIFNLVIRKVVGQEYLFLSVTDADKNTALHLAADYGSLQQLKLGATIAGPALQLQREIQWFNEVQKYSFPQDQVKENREGKTPRRIFMETHGELVKEGEKWMKDTATSCTIVAALIVTVVFAAAFQVPGGNGGYGYPLLSHRKAFTVFAVSNALALLTSASSLLIFLSILTSRYAVRDFLYSLPKRLIAGLGTLMLSIINMMAAFCSALYLSFGNGKYSVLAAAILMACVPAVVFVYLQLPLLVTMLRSTYGSFGRETDAGNKLKDRIVLFK